MAISTPFIRTDRFATSLLMAGILMIGAVRLSVSAVAHCRKSISRQSK